MKPLDFFHKFSLFNTSHMQLQTCTWYGRKRLPSPA